MSEFDQSYLNYSMERDYPAAPRQDSIKPIEQTNFEKALQATGIGLEQAGRFLDSLGQVEVPLLGKVSLADFVPFVGSAKEGSRSVLGPADWQGTPMALQQAGTGQSLTRGTGMARQLKPDASLALMDVATNIVPVAKAVGKTGKALAPKAAEMAVNVAEKTGMPVRGLNIVEPSPSMSAKATAPVSDTGFYSAVEQASMNIKRKSGSGQAMLNDIIKGENVKADEIKWIGLDDFLKGKKNVTREEVQQYIAQNKVDVQEVTLGGAEPYDAQRLTQLESEYKTLKNHPIDDPSFGEDKYDEMIRLMNIRDQSTTQTLYDAADQATRSAQRAQRQGNKITAEKYFREAELLNTRAEKLDLQGQGMRNPPKFGQYTLPGGENYREILLTLPENFGAKPNKDGYTPLSAIGDAQYRSSHWEQPNVLAHIRVNDRVDADGKKMLLVEEVQSDWHQAGRDKGYKTKESLEAWYNQNKLANDPPFAQLNSEQINTIERNRNAGMGGDAAVPDAPMKDTWYQLALKRVLKYAADNGYDRIGLTTGSRQAERYDLSKQVQEVRLVTDGKGGDLKGAIFNAVEIESGRAVNRIVNSVQDLEDVIGKELAKKLIEQTPTKGKGGNSGAWVRTVSGLDLQVGGEGMKKYYDEVYPQFLAKYGKKWGAKIGETTIPTERGDVGGVPSRYPQQEPVRFVDITPEMRQGVGKGQPLFSATAAGAGTGAATMQDKENK